MSVIFLKLLDPQDNGVNTKDCDAFPSGTAESALAFSVVPDDATGGILVGKGITGGSVIGLGGDGGR